MNRLARYAAAFVLLDAAHDLSDHVVQTDHQAANKADDWPAMAGHVGSYTAVQVAALLAGRALGLRPSWRRTAAAVALSAGTHAFLDRRWPVRWLLEHSGSGNFASPAVRVDVRGAVVPSALRGREPTVDGTGVGPLPLHGPYLADQSLHRTVLAVCAAVLAGGR